MSTRSERDKQKLLQEKHQAILSALLKEEDNKYCVDCDAKGPRWASWNLGIFLCIRCAGIHRNLGVHISKVKSVNLDSWTPEQIAMVQEMGNSRARAVYEANIPDHFRRPQTDSSLEAFIRSKYEQKKYIAKEWVPPQPKVQDYYKMLEHVDQVPEKVTKKKPLPVEEKKKKPSRPRPAGGIQLSGSTSPSSSRSKSSTEPKVANGVVSASKPPPSKKVSAVQDLLGLDNPEPASTNSSSADPFGGFIGADTSTLNSESAPAATSTEATPAQPAGQEPSSKDSLSDLSLFGDTSSGGDKKSTKESILALYGSSGGQQPMFGVPGGMYMPTGQQQGQQMNMMGMPQQNGMMGNNMMGANMGMMGNMMGQNMPPQPMDNVQSNLMVVDPLSDLRNNLMVSGVPMQADIIQQASHNMQNMWDPSQQVQANPNNMWDPSVAMYTQQQMLGQPGPMNQMMAGQMGAMPVMGNVMGGQAGMGQMPAQNMYNMPAMYQMPNQQQQLTQMQNQMGGMSLGGQPMTGYQQAGTVAAGAGGWGAPPSGQTLSTNLWQ